ncbi:hypothetical protein LSH36_25g00006 [Paralvinella palmiformis]|uniref:Proteasome-associated protein ECM29 homolog n=1 Tax=Paralvinella palmiformis TaxID=53620 RepID=A0AAD9NEU6_9ANNE|nr:hypothetical protein LSH36_25g00006 [Paralvinella palmiformis]
MAEAEELILLERVFLKIGSADSDEQFEKTVGKFLTPILLKLSSPVEGVRKKVMELLVHVNKRLKSRPQIQLPIDDLFQQYLDPNISGFVTNFTVLYIKMGFPRLDVGKQAQLVPQLIKCLEGRPDAQQNSFLQLLMPVLPHVKLPSKPEEKLLLYGLVDQPKIREKLLDHMLDFLLLPYNYGVYQERARNTQPTSGHGTPEPSFNGPPPSLSEAAFKKVLGESMPSPETVEKIKRGIVEFLSTDVYPKHEILVHLLVATADTRYSVATAADHQLKCATKADDWNVPSVVKKLYDIFQGTVAVKGKPQHLRPELKRTPASVQLRLKIFPYLLKSREATGHFPASVQVVFDCLYGANTNNKLKVMAVQFIHQLCLHCADSTFRPMGAVLLSGMIKLIAEAKEDSKLRMLAYVAVGKIARRVPQLVTRDMSLLQNFFDAISKESGDNRLALQEALSMMSEAFKGIDQTNAKLVEALIMQNIDKPEPQARQMAVEYARTVFAPDHLPSRYVLLLACGDEKDEIAAEAAKALRVALRGDDDSDHFVQVKRASVDKCRPLPPFVDMVKYIHDMAANRVKTQHKYVSGNNVLPFKPGAYVQILIYLRMCLSHDAGADPTIENVRDMKLQAPSIGKYVRQLIGDNSDVEKTIIATYINLIQQLLNAIGGAVPMYCLMEMVAVIREKIASSFVTNLDWVKNFMFSSREEVRIPAAELYSLIVSSALDDAKIIEIINEMSENLVKQALEGQHGSLLCLGYLISNKISRQKSEDIKIEDMEVEECKDVVDEKATILKAITAIVELLDNSQMLLCHGACVSLGEIGRNGAMPLPAASEDDKSVTKLQVVNKLLALVKSGKQHNKVRGQAATCAGYLCVGDRDFPHRQVVIDGLLDSAAAKQFDLHFDIGDALVCCALGTNSPEARDKWMVSEEEYKPEQSDTEDMIPDLLQALLEKYTKSVNPHIRQGACIWLVSLIKQCGKHLVIQGALLNIQEAFMGLLSESDELTQDLASKGLAIVYEICGQDEKQQLVSLLVETLTSGPRKKQQVTSETKVFEEGSLGKTPDGQSMTTYKELCSIANDLNQPDLIYKFMHLANHNAIWNTKKGAAFGFTAIAAQAGEQLAPHLHKIIPKLFRYQFDPNPKIQQAMSSIWNALVPKPKDTVDKFLPEILSDLQMNLISNQWRIRESSCLAVNDLLRGRNLDEVVDALPVLWENLFRVRDDIKESVRNAAEMALKTLSRVSIKICDPNYGKVGDKATSLILPCLVKTGLSSTVKEVQEISLSTLVKVSKSAGVLLKPHIPLLTVSLLESLSSLEPQFLNYASLHLASNEASLEKLDTARMAASKTSPMMDTVNLCVQYIDSDVMTELVPRLTDLIKNNVGLATKAGCVNLIISLSHQCPTALSPYAGKLLGVLLNGLNDRNVSVRKSYASVIGHLVKVAKDSSVEKLITRLKTWYLEKEEESTRQICGVTLHAMNRHNPDVFRRHAALALPLCFLAMHQEQEKDSTESGVRLYLTELVSLSQVALQSQAWSMKAQAAATMADIGDKLKSNLGAPHLGLLLTTLLEGLTVDGQPTIEQVLTALMRECSKENMKYKSTALIYTTDILQAYDIDKYQEISNIIYPMLDKKNTKDSDDMDDDSNIWIETEETCYQCLSKAWPNNEQTQVQYQESYTTLICRAMGNSVWKVELSALKAIHTFIQRSESFKCVENMEKNKHFMDSFLKILFPMLCQYLGKVKYSSIRMAALDITETLLADSSTGQYLQLLLTADYNSLISALRQMASTDSQPDLAHRASECIKKISI